MRHTPRRMVAVIAAFVFVVFAAACQPATRSLPLPKSAGEAALTNFRPITASGTAAWPTWSPDGKTLAYTVASFIPQPYAYRFTTEVPKAQVWTVQADGQGARRLADGAAWQFSRNGSVIYYMQQDPVNRTEALWTVDPITEQTHQLLEPQPSGASQQLADGRLVLSEWGTYAPLRIFDPASGNLQPLMKEHPSNFPEDARLSPDGTLLAYPKFQAIYLAQPDGSNPQLLSDQGGFSAQVWWSPDSQYLAYTTGNHWTDRLILANRKGETLVILFPKLEDSGHVSSLEWSPDNRWLLIATDPYDQYSRPTRLYLFDTAGNHTVLLEDYVSTPPAWSPDSQRVALTFWNGPDADRSTYAIWLADLTDKQTAASLSPSAAPTIEPTPTLSLPPADMAPEDVLQGLWDAFNRQDYRAVWAMLPLSMRANGKYADYKAAGLCVEQVTAKSTQLISGDEAQKVFAVKLDLKINPECDSTMWPPASDFYAVLQRESVNAPWLIACFNSTPDCQDHNSP